MSVTGVSPTRRSLLLLHLDKVVNSHVLKGSESLCKLLNYLAERSVDPRAVIKEFQIAAEVFGRSADFDPKLDATVRVQSSRLRAKLIEYYATDGIDDRWILELPKGTYTLSLRERPGAGSAAASPSPATPAFSTVQAALPPPVATPGANNAIFWVLSLLSIGLLGALLFLISHRSVPQAPVAAAAPIPIPDSLQTLWHGFLEGPEPRLVVFSNAEFVGRPESGMRYFNPATDSPDAILDHYTGVGEVLAIHELDRVFTLMRHEIRVKRGRLLSLDDLKSTDLIFVGSPTENLTLREIATTQEFAFRTEAAGPRKGDLAIVNRSPRPGEQNTYLASKGVPIAEDYALIAVYPGVYPPLRVMILAGTTTIGTQAAVEFVSRDTEARKLVAQAGVAKTGEVLPFEAVIQVKVSRGVPVAANLVALHRRAP